MFRSLPTSIGTLRYSPKLVGNRSEKWWAVLDCDLGLGVYYRHQFWLAHYRTVKLVRASWAEHITIIRNEEPLFKEAWEKYPGRSFEFSYDPVPESNGLYWWLSVYCPELWNLRLELGLPREPEFPFHLSFGHCEECDDAGRS